MHTKTNEPEQPAKPSANGVPPDEQPTEEHPRLVMEDLLVEDVSIDGMCGVY